MLNKNKTHLWLLTTLSIAAVIASSGCRSMPGRNMFGLRAGPSPETLAGSGPTSTYPAPPSAAATPEAIASVAGGTGQSKTPTTQGPVTKSPTTAQVAGFDISPGYATPASGTSQPNMSAAEANGIYNNSSSGGSSQSVAAASGYTFGSKTLTPKSDPATPETAPAAATNGGSSYATNSAYAPPGSGFKTPSTSFTPPPGIEGVAQGAAVQVPTPSDAVAAQPATGYTMPTDSPAVAAIAPPSPNAAQAPGEGAGNAFEPPAAAAPEFSTASAESSISAPSVSIGTPATAVSTDRGGYMPGSTSTDHGYPTGEVDSDSGGSFYR